MTQKIATKSLVTMALFAGMLCVSAYISVPLPNGSHITFLNFMVMLIAFLFPATESGLIVLVWLLLGAVGLPVFIGGSAGLGYLISPYGGYSFADCCDFDTASAGKGVSPDPGNCGCHRFRDLCRFIWCCLVDAPWAFGSEGSLCAWFSSVYCVRSGEGCGCSTDCTGISKDCGRFCCDRNNRIVSRHLRFTVIFCRIAEIFSCKK